MESYFTVWLGVFGLLFGSFLNVVIARVPEGLSIVHPRSRCPKCGWQLAWYDNIPVVSWLWLRGRCRGCQAPISPRYVLVELLTGALFLGAVARFGFDWPLAPALLFVVLIIPLIFIDAKHYFLPTPIMYGGAVAGVLLQAPGGAEAVEAAVRGVLVGFLIFRALEWVGWFLLRKEALGAGDKLLVGMIGAYTGAGSLFGVVMLASLHGAIWGLTVKALTGRAGPPLPAAEGDGAAPASGSPPGEAKAAAGPAPAPSPDRASADAAAVPPESSGANGTVTTSASAPPVDLAAAQASPERGPNDGAAAVTGPSVDGAASGTVPAGLEAAPSPSAGPSDAAPAAGPLRDEYGELVRTFSPSFLAPGLPLWKRIVLIPHTLLWQDVPDPIIGTDEAGDEVDLWEPDASSMPFGPWLGVAALEVLLLGPWLQSLAPGTFLGGMLRVMMGRF